MSEIKMLSKEILAICGETGRAEAKHVRGLTVQYGKIAFAVCAGTKQADAALVSIGRDAHVLACCLGLDYKVAVNTKGEIAFVDPDAATVGEVKGLANAKSIARTSFNNGVQRALIAGGFAVWEKDSAKSAGGDAAAKAKKAKADAVKAAAEAAKAAEVETLTKAAEAATKAAEAAKGTPEAENAQNVAKNAQAALEAAKAVTKAAEKPISIVPTMIADVERIETMIVAFQTGQTVNAKAKAAIGEIAEAVRKLAERMKSAT